MALAQPPAPWPPLFRRRLGVTWLRLMLRHRRRQSGTGLDANRISAFGLEEEQPQGSSPLTLWERERKYGENKEENSPFVESTEVFRLRYRS